MLIIRGTQDIYISRSDQRKLAVNLTTETASGVSDYEMADTEYLVFKLWDDRFFHRQIKTLRSADGETTITIPPDFTAGLGGEYAYSVDLRFADGTKETVIGQSPSAVPKFVVLEA